MYRPCLCGCFTYLREAIAASWIQQTNREKKLENAISMPQHPSSNSSSRSCGQHEIKLNEINYCFADARDRMFVAFWTIQSKHEVGNLRASKHNTNTKYLMQFNCFFSCMNAICSLLATAALLVVLASAAVAVVVSRFSTTVLVRSKANDDDHGTQSQR